MHYKHLNSNGVRLKEQLESEVCGTNSWVYVKGIRTACGSGYAVRVSSNEFSKATEKYGNL
eukprot:Pgem_evm1s16843